MSARISLEEAQTRAMNAAQTLAAEPVSTDAALGRVLAEDVRYPTAQPAFDHAAMDGYAIAGDGTVGATFVVRGESRAGAPAAHAVSAGEAMAISTGAALPEGADTIVPWEHVTREGDALRLVVAAKRAQHLRRAGDDAPLHAIAVARGTRLGPRHLGALAAAERANVQVAQRPRVLLAITGDELRDAGTDDAPGLVVDSNGPMLAALAARAGATVVRVRVPDSAGALRAFLEDAMGRADLIATVGGAADGAHDHVARVLRELDAEQLFRGVAIKPGKPVGLARVGGVPLLSLPGNPGSAYVTFALLGLPILRVLAGESPPRRLHARLAAPLRAPADRAALHSGTLTMREATLYFAPAPNAASGSVPGVASASALALIPAGESHATEAIVEVVDLEPA